MTIEVANSKDDYWQMVRGICIILVILIHCNNGLSLINDGNNFYYLIIVRQIINFPVVVFVFMSGYFSYIDLHNIKIKDYYFKRLKKLFIPYVVWSLFYMVAYTLMGEKTEKSIMYALFTGKAASHLYFIVLLIQLVLLTPLLIKMLDYRFGYLIYAITPIYMIILYIYQIQTKKILPFYNTLFPAWINFYYLGIDIRQREKNKKVILPFKMKQAIGILLVALIISILEAFKILEKTDLLIFTLSQIKISSYIYAGMMIYIILFYKSKYKSILSSIVKIGDISYGIFFVHMFWIIIFDRMAFLLNINFSILAFYHVMQLLFTLFMSIVSCNILKKIVLAKYAELLFGIS